jgi:hypothetical protein
MGNPFSPPIGSAASATEIAVAFQSSTDFTIWITASTSPDTPASWNLTHLATATALTAPAAAFWNGSVSLLYGGIGSPGAPQALFFGTGSTQTVQQLPSVFGATQIPPALVVNAGQLWGFFLPVGGNNTIALLRSDDGQTWALTPLPPAITTTAAPTAAVFNGNVYVLFQSSTDSTLWIANSSDGFNWGLAHLPAAITSANSPSLAAMNGALYAVFQSSSDETIYISKSTDGTSWDLHQLPPAITTSAAPTVVAMSGELYVIYQSSIDNTIWLISSADGVSWSDLTHLPPAITVGSDGEELES